MQLLPWPLGRESLQWRAPSVEAKVEVEMADGMGWLGLWVGCRSLEPTDVYDPASEKNTVLFRDGFPTDVMSFLWQVLLKSLWIHLTLYGSCVVFCMGKSIAIRMHTACWKWTTGGLFSTCVAFSCLLMFTVSGICPICETSSWLLS